MSHAFSFTRTAAWLGAAVGALTLSGCVVAPVDDGYYSNDVPYYSSGHQTDGFYNGTYYPAMPYEVVPVAPYAGAIWVQGDWAVDNGRRYWRPGRYERPGWNRPGNHNWNRPDNNRPQWNRPNDNRPHGQRPGWNRPNEDRPNFNRPNGNRPDRPDSRPNQNNRPPSHQFAPPGQINRPSGNQPGVLRPIAPAPGAMRPNRPNLAPNQMYVPSGQQPSNEFLNRKDPNRGG